MKTKQSQKSHLETHFLLILTSLKLQNKFIREYRFALGRRFRFDFADVKNKIACEIDGGIWGHGRHTSGKGFKSDREKDNLALCLGWKPLHYTDKTSMRRFEEDYNILLNQK